MSRYCSYTCGIAGCDGSQSFSKGGPDWPPPKNWRCPKCGYQHHSTRRQSSEVGDLLRAGKGEISPLDQQKIILREMESLGRLDSKAAARHKRRLAHHEKTGFYRVTDDDRRKKDLKEMKAELEEAEYDRQHPERPVTTQEAVEAAKALEVIPESAG